MAFADDVVARRKEFVKLEDGAAKAMHDELQSMLDDAQAKLATMADFTDDQGRFVDNAPARKRMEAVIRDIQSALSDALLKATDDLVDARETAFKMGAADMQFATEKATGNDFEASTAQLFRQAAKEAATRKVLLDPTQNKTDGDKPKEAFDGVEQATSADIQELLSKAILRGSDIRQTSKKLQEVGDVTKRAATRIVRTNINAAQNDAHMEFYRAHPDVFSGVRWEAVMDARTSGICAALNGKFFALDDDPPGPPAHPNCRCTLVGVLIDDEMEQDKQNQTKSVKDTATNQYVEVRRDEKFADWLKRQPKEKSTKITGSKVKDDLFRDGHLQLDELIKPNLKARSDKEAVEMALAKDPKDPKLQALATKIGSLKRSLQEIDVSDAALAAKNTFDKGQGGEDSARAKRMYDAKKTAAEEEAKAAEEAAKKAAIAVPKPGDDNFKPSNADEAQAHFEKLQPKIDARLKEVIQLQRDENRNRIMNLQRGDPEWQKSYDRSLALGKEETELNRGQAKFFEEMLKRPTGEEQGKTSVSAETRFDGSVSATPQQIKEFKTALDWARQFIDGSWKSSPLKLNYTVDRNSYDRKWRTINGSGVDAMKKGGDKHQWSTVLHEWTHHLEYDNPKLLKATTTFLKARTKGETTEQLKKVWPGCGYDDWEVYREDEFEAKGGSKYMGKWYYDDTKLYPGLAGNPTTYGPNFRPKDSGAKLEATEVLTMGIERMVRNPVEFARRDPEYFKLIWQFMDGTLGGNVPMKDKAGALVEKAKKDAEKKAAEKAKALLYPKFNVGETIQNAFGERYKVIANEGDVWKLQQEGTTGLIGLRFLSPKNAYDMGWKLA